MTVIEHWIATESHWTGKVTGRHVIFEIEVEDYQKQGWKVEGPYVLASTDRGAVETERAEIVTMLQEIADAEPRMSEARIAILAAAKRIHQRGQS
jgi:hypothetical protein